MHISRVDLNLLVVLDTIYTEGGITKAADKLHLTQPAISHALARLRDLFNDPLFERQGHRMVPTALTKRIIDPLRGSLQSLGSLLNDTQSFDAATSTKRFVIGLRDFMESTVMPPLMRTLAGEAPGVEVASVRASRRSLEGELAAGTLDLAVDVLLPVSDAVKFTRITVDGAAVVARQGHPAIQGSVDIDTYLAQRHVLVTTRRQGPGFEDIELRRLGMQRQVALRCQYYFAACRTVSQTDLVLTMPESYAHMVNKTFGNQVLPMPAPLSSMDAYLYWHASTDNDAANRWLRSVMLSCYAR
ncbi:MULTISPECIES: LysR family transcriptional regulator [unclassified Pseudacidovorax]|uniref:LysR family transcriptional regulator n=1 Tax=unclassified Pseudacidovorax TaxID=2620592 RepID=UPI000955A975|nr:MULTISPECIES: LysR family transcriptional regulator [unclassified Pseudacidovorax]SIQ47522.1 DNA-binding transcriptional regulator, LysR family [Pseudacidovorax sp. RU35E]